MNTMGNATPTNRTAPSPLSCTACRQPGIQCVTPTRARAERTSRKAIVVARDSELLRRIHRLENLLSTSNLAKSLALTADGKESQVQLTEEARNSVLSTHAKRDDGPHLVPQTERADEQYAFFIKQQGNEVRYRSGEFWTSLGDEVSGIRQLLESQPEEEDELQDSNLSTVSISNTTPQLVFGYPDSKAIPDPIYPSDPERERLFHFYFTNIDPICKILHRPSISFHLLGTKDLLDDRGRFKFSSIDAITFSMYFAAVMSMTPEECLKNFSQDKDILLAQFQQSAEVALMRADFMDTTDIVTLQAFVLYIMTLRFQNKNRSSWALIGLAIRIAHSQRLHIDPDCSTRGTFEIELRRRLWWQLIILDMRGAEDRGTEPMILESSYTTLMPSNCNDVELEFKLGSLNPEECASQCSLVDKAGITEMTFGLMCMHMTVVFRKLNFVTLTREPRLTLQDKEALVKECANKLETKYLAGCDPTDKSVWIIYMFGRLLILKLWLSIHYPLHVQAAGTVAGSRQQSLQDAISFLTISDLIEENSFASGLHLFFARNVPWHAVAVMLAELLREPRGPLADQAWAIIDKSFTKWSNRMDGARDGMPWRPMKILLEKAQTARLQSAPAMATPDNLQAALPCNPSWKNAHLVPELTDLSLETNRTYTYTHDTFQEQNFMDQSHQPLGFDAFPVVDKSLSRTSLEITDIPINWDDWNEFIYDSNKDGADKNDSFWGMAMQM
ncbi:uncharacterized protein BP5553_06796 [Venustampulla echinocandica]|uniref:Xylanolytic transcriptional activator regulatory domain-containing protein n=1 Tax=Venustampulla echinocandica TaxID=2656787 RepID=A0A370TKY3_9HELO|nr:uncharacterized protein BP5553_06796 [Venustampulla echinocandica]RDL36184.1 hypothetical protein BP5553_06796 [Venustampulla echinocandica]